MENSAILKKIKNTRLIKRISQEEIAKELNVSVPTYSRFERGITKTNLTILHKVCQFLDIEIYKSEKALDVNLLNLNTDFNINDIAHLNTTEKIKLVIDLLKKQRELNSILINNLKELILEVEQ